MSPRLTFLALLLLPAAASGQQAEYPRPNLLIEPAALAQSKAGTFSILDTRKADKYQAGHIPGAVRVDVGTWAKAFAAGQDPEAWAKRIGAAGVGRVEQRVVVYGDDVKEAARVWWILRYWGLKDVRLLNGGWQGWQGAGGKAETGQGLPVKSEVKLTAQPGRLATRQQVLEGIKEKRFSLFDTRSEGEHCGDTLKAKRGGTIPGAKHLEWSEVIDKKTQRFKAPGELTKLFKDAGVDFTRPAVTFCQSGGRAAVMAFALELMGAREVRNYYRSWSEWGNAEDTPIVTPKKK